jgi:hypothetical protein
MLYDPKWEKPEVKADPFTLESLIAWLETKDPSETYNWHDCNGRCLLAQYVSERDLITTRWESAYMKISPSIRYKVAEPLPNTFGAALERARKHLTT